MLSVFICEDNKKQKDQIHKCIENCIIIHNLDMKIALSTHNPDEIVRYIKNNHVIGLYFLDINLNHNMNGLELAEMIRKYDPRGFLLFITSHSDSMPLVFKYKLEAMDFIIKDDFFDFKSRIYECILNAQQKYLSATSDLYKCFSFKLNDKIISIEHNKILFFETSANSKHKITMYTTIGMYEFYESLKNLQEVLGNGFVRCHHSFIINAKQELRFELQQKTVYFDKQKLSCPVSIRFLKKLVTALKQQ